MYFSIYLSKKSIRVYLRLILIVTEGGIGRGGVGRRGREGGGSGVSGVQGVKVGREVIGDRD